MINNYIPPVTRAHSTYADARKFIDEHYANPWSREEDSLPLDTLAAGRRTLIIGEPGVGKSLLLEKIQAHLDANGASTLRVLLRRADALKQTHEFLQNGSGTAKVLLLDALDEVKASDIPRTIQDIEQLANNHPNVAIFLSGRWVFIGRYAKQFPEFRFVTISPFTSSQVRNYLVTAGRSESDVDAILHRLMSFGHPMLVVQIPRYLSYLNEYLVVKGIDAALNVSRNDLFEYFIYSKLDLESEKLDEDMRALMKRMLEKLALAMEIYQTNVITQDELMTFFDDVDSDLKRVAFSQIKLEVFYHYSLLKVGRDDPDRIEFDNAEFQEYLAAKEIMRLPEPARAAFAFAADSQVNEIYPSWYNALTFLVDMNPPLLTLLVEYSGLRADRFRLMDEAFLNFLARVDPRRVPTEMRRCLFVDVMDYHERTLQWLPIPLASALADFCEPSTESDLKIRAVEAESAAGVARLVRLANVAYAVGYLLKRGIAVDRPYWRAKLLEYATDGNVNTVLQRHALLALEYFGDPTVVDDLPDLSGAEELLARAFLDMCKEIAPNHPKSVHAFITAVRSDELHGRYGLFALTAKTSLRSFLEALCNDEVFRKEFIDDASIFKEQDLVIVHHIAVVLDDEIRELAKCALVAALHFDVAHCAERSAFIAALWRLLRSGSKEFVAEMVRRIRVATGDKAGLYFASRFFSDVIEIEDVEPYILAMQDAGEQYIAHLTMQSILHGSREGARRIYEAGRVLLPKEYLAHEEAQSKNITNADRRIEATLQEFRKLLEPEPGKYSHGVFQFYNRHVEELRKTVTAEDLDRIMKLLGGTVFKFMDPGVHNVTIKDQKGSRTITTNSSVQIFGDALVTAQLIGFDLGPYRSKIVNLIPFAQSDQLKAIFKAVKNLRPGEFTSVIDVYKSRQGDLWLYNPDSFVRAVEQYHTTEAVPILKAFVFEEALDKYVRRSALQALDLLMPDAEFLGEVVERYSRSTDEKETEIAESADALLITTHGNGDAIRRRLQQVVRRAAAFTRPSGSSAHAVGALESEIVFGKTFAKPLMELKYPGYERDFLALLDKALALWSKGDAFHEYASYLWGIVYAYFDNLKEQRSYHPLLTLERAIGTMKDRDGANWLAARMAGLRRSYLSYLGRPASVAKAIAKYNDARKVSDKEIRNSADLLFHVQSALDTELRRWIEGEGAYEILHHRISGSGRQEYEKLIQKTLKAQIENVLLKRGFQVEVLREPQLLDDKRTDLLIRYGFAGPLIIEVKLTSNKDIQGTRIANSASFSSMSRYMEGYGASHGIFMVIDNHGARNLAQVETTFRGIEGVSVISFDCAPLDSRVPARRRAKRSIGKAADRRVRKRKG